MKTEEIKDLFERFEAIACEYEGVESKARNQSVQTMFRMIGYGENIGSGFPLILHTWNEMHWVKPELIEQPELLQVKLVLNIEQFGEKFGEKQLTERQQVIYDYIKENGDTTAKNLARNLAVSQRTAEREISFLRNNRYIDKVKINDKFVWITLK